MKLEGRFVVTGGAGFIGSHLCETLLGMGCEVVCIDNLITGRESNLRGFLGNKKFSFVKHDIVEGVSVSGGVAGIFHMASPASPVDYARFPIETLHVGALGSDHVLKLAVEKNCPVLVASTSEVYGDPLEHPQKESYWGNVNTTGPRGCYDESKRYLEALTMAYHRSRGAKTRIVRIFNTYGPRMRTNDGRVVPNFCLQAIKNEPVTIYGDGSQTRSFCYVTDLLDGLFGLFLSDYSEPVNIGNPSEHRIVTFAEKIVALCGSQSKMVYRDLPIDDPKRRKPDITKAKALLGWEPKVKLDDGLRSTIEYFRGQVADGDHA